MSTTSSTSGSVRRALFGTFAVSAFGGVLAAGLLTPGATPTATGATDPCAASQIAKTIGSVATSTGSYLDAHPETNQALTTIAQLPAGPQSLAATKSYFDANPQAGKDMQQLQQPLVSLSTQCRLPITVPQLLGLMQAAQNQGTGLPATLTPAQSLGSASTSAAGSAAGTAAGPAGGTGTGPLPGPAAITPR